MYIKRIIVLDDDPAYVEMFADFSKYLGVTFEGAESTEELLQIELAPTDLILLDVYLEGEDGLDTLRTLDSLRYAGYLSLMSGAGEEILRSISSYVESLNINQLPYLSKPTKLKDVELLLHITPKAHSFSTMTAADVEQFSKVFNKESLASWFELGYIYPVFQPQVCVQTREIIGFECLVRVEHPNLDCMQPSVFINLLEGAGLITQFTLIMLEHALSKVKGLMKTHPKLSCSFNVSALSLDTEFADSFLQITKDQGIRPSNVIIELTESSAVSISKEALYAISRLKVSGFPLSIDDFGTGYSSIRQLAELPFNELKVDRSFVMELENNLKSRAIVDATIELAHSLNYRIVVEGVETNEQKCYLQNKGNVIAQGYYFYKPMRFEKLDDIFAQQPKTGALNA